MLYSDLLSRRLQCAVLVCDRERVVAAAGAGRTGLQGLALPPAVEALLARRKLYTAPAAGPRLPLGEKHTLLCAAPILARGDMEGGVLLPGTARDPLPDAETVQAAAIAAEFLARWMEE